MRLFLSKIIFIIIIINSLILAEKIDSLNAIIDSLQNVIKKPIFELKAYAISGAIIKYTHLSGKVLTVRYYERCNFCGTVIQGPDHIFYAQDKTIRTMSFICPICHGINEIKIEIK